MLTNICQRKPSTLRVSNAKNKCAIAATKTRQPMISAIPKENVRGRIMARIPQAKVTMLQIITHLDTFFITGSIDSMFMNSDPHYELVTRMEKDANCGERENHRKNYTAVSINFLRPFLLPGVIEDDGRHNLDEGKENEQCAC